MLIMSKLNGKFWFRETRKSDTGICFSLLVDANIKLVFSNGNRYIGSISHRLLVTSQARLFTIIRDSLFSLKNKSLRNYNII